MKKKKSILFIDDEELNLLSLEKTFAIKYCVFSTQTLVKAKEIIETNNINLILCDIVLGNENSISFLKKIAIERPDIKIVVVSGYLDEYRMEIRELKNCLFFIQKPKTPKYYDSIIKEVFRGNYDRY